MIIDFRREKTRTSGEGLTRRKSYNARFARFNLDSCVLNCKKNVQFVQKCFFYIKNVFKL